MYSRTRTMAAEDHYANNVPPVYGGSRFYRGTQAAVTAEPEIRAEDVRAAVPAAGIPVQYEARTLKLPPSEYTDSGCSACEEDVNCAAQTEISGAEDKTAEEVDQAVSIMQLCKSETQEEHGKLEKHERHEKQEKNEGFLSSLFGGDQEEILLIALLLLLSGEHERPSDVIVILLLLIILK